MQETEYLLEQVCSHFQISSSFHIITKFFLPTKLSYSKCTCHFVKIGVEISRSWHACKTGG